MVTTHGTMAWAGLAGLVLLMATAGCGPSQPRGQTLHERQREAWRTLRQDAPAAASGCPAGESPLCGPVLEAALPTGELTLAEARQLALRGNPDVHAAQARLEAAAARLATARARYLPTLSVTHNSTRTFHTPASRNRLNTALQPATTLPTNVNDTSDLAYTTLINALRGSLFGTGAAKGDTNSFSEHATAFTGSWLVFDSFARQARLLSAGHAWEASQYGRADAQRIVLRATDAAYFQVQLAHERLEIARADEVFSQEQLEVTEKLQSAGRATQADVNNFKVRVLAAQAEVTAARGARDAGRVVLAELIGLDGAELPADLTLSPLEVESEADLVLPDVDTWLAEALQRRPDIARAAHTLRSYDEELRAARAAYGPTVQVSASWGFDRVSNLKYTSDDQSSAAGIEFRWDLYLGGQRRALIHEAAALRSEAGALLSARRRAAASEVRQAIIDLRNAQEEIVLQRESLDTARANREVIQAGYAAGRESLTRLNEAQRDYVEAEAALASARIRLRQAWSDLESAAALRRDADPQLPE